MPLSTLGVFLKEEQSLQERDRHRHFTVTATEDCPLERSWSDLLEFAPVKDIEEAEDEYLDDDAYSNLKEKLWTRRRTYCNGESELVQRFCEASKDKKSLMLEDRTPDLLKEQLEEKMTVSLAKYNFTRYYLDTGAWGFDIYIDVVELTGDVVGYAVVGTIDFKEDANLEDALKALFARPVYVMPVPSKVYQVLKYKEDNHPTVQKCLEDAALEYQEYSPVPEDPLRHHKLVAETNIEEWFKHVSKGAFYKDSKYAELKKMDWWTLSTLNIDELERYSDDEKTNADLVVYLRSFSHFRYYELAQSLRTHPSRLKKEDWIRISLHTPEDLVQYGNVPAEVAEHMLRQSYRGRGY